MKPNSSNVEKLPVFMRMQLMKLSAYHISKSAQLVTDDVFVCSFGKGSHAIRIFAGGPLSFDVM